MIFFFDDDDDDSRKYCSLKIVLCLNFFSENKCFSYSWVSFLNNNKNLFYNSQLLVSSLSNTKLFVFC